MNLVRNVMNLVTISVPAVRWLTKVGVCTPLTWANCSWVIPAFVLAARSSRPKARVNESRGARIRARMLARPQVVH